MIQLYAVYERLTLFYFILFIFLFLVAFGLRCCPRDFSGYGERGPLFVAVQGLPIAVASPVGSTGSRRTDLSSCGMRAQ